VRFSKNSPAQRYAVRTSKMPARSSLAIFGCGDASSAALKLARRFAP
jgi:hypothetical protein